MGKLQDADFSSSADLAGRGSTDAQLLNDTKIYVTANSLNKTLNAAITAGDLSGGGSSPEFDTVLTLKAKSYTSLSTFSSGKGTLVDGSALPGGTHAGTDSLNTTTPLFDTRDFKYVAAASNVGDYLFSPNIAVAPGYRGKAVKLTLTAKYDGTDNDMRFCVRDSTNNNRLTPTTLYVKASTTGRKYEVIFPIPSTCQNIIIGYEVLVSNSGKILYWDYAEINDTPIVTASTYSLTAYRTSVQSIADNTFTKVILNATDNDLFAAFDTATNYRWIAPRDGYIYAVARFIFDVNSTTGKRAVYIYKNGTTTIAYDQDGQANSGVLKTLHASIMSHRVSKNDYIEMWCQQSSGGAVNTATGTDDCALDIGYMW